MSWPLVAAFVGGLLTGALVQDWRHEATAATLAKEHAQERQAAAEAQAQAVQAVDLQRVAEVGQLEDARETLLKKEKTQNAEIEKLRAAVAAGDRRLRIRATCPVPAAGVPATPAGAGGIAHPTAELDPVAQSAYFALRDGIVRTETLLGLCRARLFQAAGVPVAQ